VSSAERLRSRFVSVCDLDALTRDDMFRVFSAHYDLVSRSLFESDLAGKTEALILKDQCGRLVGFSTLQLWDEDFEGERLRILFSGDTIIDSACWGTQALAFNWIRRAGAIRAEAPERRLFWFLIVKGHRTYRYLPTFAIQFHPDWRQAGPPFLQRLAHHLGRRRFGEDYDAEAGVVHFAAPRGQLAAAVAEPDGREAARADVQYFLARNPNYRTGDELVCVCELCEGNLQPIARRVFRQGLVG
jgi:hypothetical protein